MTGDPPSRIAFGDYSDRVPANIPAAVQQATARFVLTRSARVAEREDWEALRQCASDLRRHTLDHLDSYLELAEQRVTGAGGQVHWAKDAEAARAIVVGIAGRQGAKFAVKSKSMATEEIGLNRALADAGIEAIETDLGEYIIQLDGTGPSHIIVPAVHLKKEDIAKLFRDKLGVDAPADAQALTAIARQTLRERFLSATLGISGGNFLVAETGTLVVVTNEGNGRLCTTLPDVHVAVVGIDKVVPNWQSLTVLLKLLARSATGQKITTYTSFITGPRRSRAEGGPRELHLVLLDNGRSRILQSELSRDVLKCIRCGACLNVCPVYRNVGGFAYGWFISGPIGSIFTTEMLGTGVARELPFASSLCGACNDVCPVKIPITRILLDQRRRVVSGSTAEQGANVPVAIRAGARLGAETLSRPWLYRTAGAVAQKLSQRLSEDGWHTDLPRPFDRWTRVRPLRALSGGFRDFWRRRGRGRNET